MWVCLIRCAAILAAVLFAAPALAQSAPSELEIRVHDGAGRPVADARVFISGPLSMSVLTPADGIVRFSDVDPGLYGLRVVRRDFDVVEQRDVEILAGRRRIIEVTLSRSSRTAAAASPAEPLKVIGRVSARPAIDSFDVDVDEGKPIRRISENLADALDKIAGVTVLQAQDGNTLTISLRNGQASNTTSTIGGSPVTGAAGATLRAVAADLSTGVSVDSTSSIASIGGAVNFRTLEPSRTWQLQTSLSYGSLERSSAQFSASGSLKKLGIAAQHAVRGGDNQLTGLTFADSSGEAYVHDGSSYRIGDFVKLRYPVGSHFNVTAQYLRAVTESSPLCTRYVTNVPCGFGPAGRNEAFANLVSFGVQGQIGNVTATGTFSHTGYNGVDDQSGRRLIGVPAPYVSTTTQQSTNFAVYATLALGRHTLLANLGSSTGSGLTTASGAYGGVSPYRLLNAYYILGDTIKLSDKYSVTIADGLNETLTEKFNAADIRLLFTPNRRESISIGTGVYNGGTARFQGGFFSDPAIAIYNCAGDTVLVDAPSDPPQAGIFRSYSIGYDRRGKLGSIRVAAYQTESRGGSMDGLYPLSAFRTSPLPAGYLDAISTIWNSPLVCGGKTFDPSHVFASSLISGAGSRNRGLDASGQLSVGRAVIVQSSYSIAQAVLAASDDRLLAPGSPYTLGGQLPFRPLHRASLLVDAVQPRAKLEWIANAAWTSGNNGGGLKPYVLVSGGVTWTAVRGRVSVFANNVLNAESSPFATNQFAQPFQLRGGGQYFPVPTPLAPRSITVLYAARLGRTR